MTVYTVIGHITNAILTFEPLQIPSNLSGGPQFLLQCLPYFARFCERIEVEGGLFFM